MDSHLPEMPATPRYDVALSFAGEDRQYVEAVANHLRSLSITVFYDGYEKANLWGKDLYAHLSEIYGRSSRYTVMFLSEHYARKLWTNHERKSAQEKAFVESREYILPVRFDETEVPGVPKTVGYVDARTTSPKDLSELIREKLGERDTNHAQSNLIGRDVQNSRVDVIPMRELLWPLFERIEQIQSGAVPEVISGIGGLDYVTGGWRDQ